MKKQFTITDAELPIMQILWEKDFATSTEIYEKLKSNKSTVKTLISRLVSKGAVKTKEINTRTNLYYAAISKQDYIAKNSNNFISKFFDGSAEKLLLNFVKQEHITKNDLQRLIEIIEEEK